MSQPRGNCEWIETYGAADPEAGDGMLGDQFVNLALRNVEQSGNLGHSEGAGLFVERIRETLACFL